MKSMRAASRTYPTRPETNPAPEGAQPASLFDQFLVAFAGTNSIETSLWLIVVLLIISGYCLALLSP